MESGTAEMSSRLSNSNACAVNATGEESRRSACDRCRGQKLRCLRNEGNLESCKRCHRAKVVCVSSSPLRMGRPARTRAPAATGGPSGGRKKRQESSVSSMGVITASLSTVEGENGYRTEADEPLPSVDTQEVATNPNKRLRNDSNFATPSQSGTQSWHLQSPKLADAASIIPQRATFSGGTPYAASYTAQGTAMPGTAYGASFPEDNVTQMPSPLSNVFDLGRMIFPDNGEFSSGDFIDDNFGLTTSSSASSPKSRRALATASAATDRCSDFTYETTTHGDAQSAPRCMHIPLTSQQKHSDIHMPFERQNRHVDRYQPMRDKDKNEKGNIQHMNCEIPFSSPEHDPWADGIQQLSKLNFSLYQQLKRINSCPWADTLSTCFNSIATGSSPQSSACLPIGNILRNSQVFAEILKSFSPSIPSTTSATSSYSSPSSPSSSSSSSEVLTDTTIPHHKHRQNSSLSGMFYGEPSYTPQKSSSSAHIQNSASDLDTFGPLAQPDTPMMLSVMTCYIRLTRIYSTIFSHMHKSLLDLPSEHGFLPCALPDLQLGGFPLQSHGHLQIMIFIEVSVHMLDRVEEALGLPDECRIRGRGGKARTGGGILGGSSSKKLMETLMKLEETERGAYGKGDPKTLREHVKRMKRLLRSNLRR